MPGPIPGPPGPGGGPGGPGGGGGPLLANGEDGDTGDATAPIDPTTTATNDKEIFILYRVNSTN